MLSYCVLWADVCGLDLDEILNAKGGSERRQVPGGKGPGQRRQIHRADLTVLRSPTAPRPAARGRFFRIDSFSPERTNFPAEFWKTLW